MTLWLSWFEVLSCLKCFHVHKSPPDAIVRSQWVTRSSIKLFWTAKKWEMTIPLCAVLLCSVLCITEQTPCKAAYHLAPIYLHCRHLTALQNTNTARFSDEKLWLPSQGKGREWSACPHISQPRETFCTDSASNQEGKPRQRREWPSSHPGPRVAGNKPFP